MSVNLKFSQIGELSTTKVKVRNYTAHQSTYLIKVMEINKAF